MRLQTILYIIQLITLIAAFVCTLIMTIRMKKAINYMVTYCESRGSSKNNVTREFRKVLRMLGGK